MRLGKGSVPWTRKGPEVGPRVPGDWKYPRTLGVEGISRERESLRKKGGVEDRSDRGAAREVAPEDQNPYQDQEAAREGAQGCPAPRAGSWPSVAPHSVETQP